MLSAHEIVGYVASVLVLLTFIARDMRLLRVMAILSNVAFILYAVLDHLPPVLFLHLSLLPVNVFRLTQLRNRIASGPPTSMIPISNFAARSRRHDSAQRATPQGAVHLPDCLD